MLKLALAGEWIVGLTVLGLIIAWFAAAALTLYRLEQWIDIGLSYRLSSYDALKAGETPFTDICYLLVAGTGLAVIRMVSGIRQGLMR